MEPARVSIPAAVRRTIQNIKEIAGNHTDEEVYAALRECHMDPNETAQKLLHQDTSHEVKRKRDKKKESNKESADPQWRPETQGRGGKGGRGNYSARQSSNSSDGTGRNALAGKENDLNPSTGMKISTSVLSLSGGLSKGPSQIPAAMAKNSLPISHLPSSDFKGAADLKSTPEEVVVDLGSHVSQTSTLPPPSIPGACTSVSDSVLTPSLEAHSQCETIANKYASRSQRAAGLVSDDVSAVPKDTSQPSVSSSIVLPSGSRPLSSYSSHLQQPGVGQEAVPNKEWKPKPTNKPAQAGNVTHNDVPVAVKDAPQSVLVSTSIHKEDISSEMDKKLSDMQLFDKQHVIIPDHVQITESEKYGISFGSFGTSFEHTVGFPNVHENEKSSMLPEYESSQEVEEVVEEPASSSYQGASFTVEVAAEPGQQQLTAEMTDTISRQEVDNFSNTPETAKSDHSKDTAAPHLPHDSVQNTYSAYASAPQSQGNQIPLVETSEYQVQQTNDLIANYYTYQPIADADGNLSAFAAPGDAVKSGNMSVLPTQTGQNQETERQQSKIMRGETILDDLPESVFIREILLRLAADDILRCRAVRKSWRLATSTQDFLLAHHRHQPSLPVIDLIKREGRYIDRQLFVYFDDSPGAASRNLSQRTILCYPSPCLYSDNLVIHAACDGLLVVSFHDSKGYFDVFNPITRQRAPLPLLRYHEDGRPVTAIHIAGFYQHRASKEYQLLYFIWTGNEDFVTYTVDFHILAIGYKESRPIKEPPLQQGLLDGLTGSKNAPVLNRGNLHWLLAQYYSRRDCSNIIVFDTEVETFRWMRNPPCQYTWMSLLELDGMLAMCSSRDSIVIDIYVMHDYEAEVWAPTYKINLLALEASPQLYLPAGPLRKIVTLNESELLIEHAGCILHCDIDGKFLGRMECDEGQGNHMHITSFRFQENIVPLPFLWMQEDDGDCWVPEDEGDHEIW